MFLGPKIGVMAWPPSEDWIGPGVPNREELIRYADAVRAKLDPGWSAWIEAGDLGPRFDHRVVFHHALSSSVTLNFTSLEHLEARVKEFLDDREFDLVKSFPAGVGTPNLAMQLRWGVHSWKWAPEELFEIGQTLYLVDQDPKVEHVGGLISWDQIAWLIRAGAPFRGWPADQQEEADEVLARIENGLGPERPK
jgi:hypothetical protein